MNAPAAMSEAEREALERVENWFYATTGSVDEDMAVVLRLANETAALRRLAAPPPAPAVEAVAKSRWLPHIELAIRNDVGSLTFSIESLKTLAAELKAAQPVAPGEVSEGMVDDFMKAFHNSHDNGNTYRTNIRAGLQSALSGRGGKGGAP